MQSMIAGIGGNAEKNAGWIMATFEAVLLKVSDTLTQSPDAEALADYLSHTIDFPLASIRSDAQLEQAIGKINTLVDQPALSPGDEMYLYALADLVEFYESEHIAAPAVRGIDLLRHLVEANDLQTQDRVSLLGRKSIVSAVLDGKRPLTLTQIARLSDRFRLPADLFIDRSAAGSEENQHPHFEQE
jgi:HTH-type transcriptional regulator/antitoxin HigA